MKKMFFITATLLIALGIAYLSLLSPITYYTETYPVKYTVQQATQAADTVLIGTIKEVNNPIWNSKNGQKPDKDSPNMKLIFKPTIVQVDEYLKNTNDQKEITIINPGGTIGRETVKMEGIPSFEKDQKVVLFLRKDIDPGDGVKRYDPIWSFTLNNEIAKNMRTDEEVPITELKEKIKNFKK